MASELPLEGIRVLDLSRQLPGGFCSLLLADYGADVVKIESAEGDPLRSRDAEHAALNRGKRSVVLDLKDPAGRDAFIALAREADVVLESFRPGVMARLGIGYEALAAVNPRLVFCSITGYGQDGPYAERAGHDLSYIARSGMLDLSGELDGPPVQPAVQVADVGGGSLMAAVGILLALQERHRSGRGQYVDTSMLDGTLAMIGGLAARLLAGEPQWQRGRLDIRGDMVSYMPYPCKDGWLTLAATEPKFWAAFCDGLGREDLLEHRTDPSDGWAQGQIEAITLKRTRAEWDAFAAEHECCLETVRTLEEALADPQVAARGTVVELDDGTRAVGPPIKLSRTPGDARRRPAPGLGEHTAEILAPSR